MNSTIESCMQNHRQRKARVHALKADINEEAWEALYSTKSYLFEKPSKGKIAVKVINHFGDEVMKVYEVSE